MNKLLLIALSLSPSAFAQTASAPALFAPGVISTQDEEYRLTFTPDGQTVYFARSSSGSWFPFSRQSTIYTSTLKAGKWSAPQVAPFSGQYSDIDPFISPDGKRLYFSSIRPVNGQERQDSDLWMVERQGATWSPPVHLGAGVNSDRDELYPSVDRRGVLYFGAQDAPADWNIRRAVPDARGLYPTSTRLPAPVTTGQWEFNPAISADGATLVFTAHNRPGEYGSGDLYITTLKSGAWAKARNLGSTVNSAADEYHPSLSPDGRTLYFVRRGAATNGGDLYRVPLPRF